MKLLPIFKACLLFAKTFEVVALAQGTHHLRAVSPFQGERSLAFATEKKTINQAPRFPAGHNPFIPLKEDSERRVMHAIDKFRAEICYRMKVQHDVDFGALEKCEKFMRKVCRPGRDDSMDGDSHEITSGEGYCTEYFPEAERKAREQIEEEDRAAKAASTPPTITASDPDEVVAPAPASSEAQAPAPAPRSEGFPSRREPKENEAYYKKGVKDPCRLHMDENLKLPAQGYWGELVSHDDMETVTEDWGVEFGAKASFGTEESYCKKYCDTKWCIRRGYCGHERKNFGVAVSVNVLVSMVATVFALVAL